MANKFQKSVMERLEQQSTHVKKNTSDMKPEASLPHAVQPSTQEPASLVVDVVQAVPVESPPSVSKGKAQPLMPRDISQYIRREPDRQAKNKTFYLDLEVIEGLHRVAVSQKITDSKLCNDILRNILGLDESCL